MTTTKAVRCGVCGGSARGVRLHSHLFVARIFGREAAPADVEFVHDGFVHVIAGGSVLPEYARLTKKAA